MKLFKDIKLSILVLLIMCSVNAISQESKDNEDEVIVPKKGLHLGLYIGSYFANQYTAGIYDGYGFDIDGNKNSWENSWMNQKINMQYGGYGFGGQPDQIAQELNVDFQTWKFDPSDMPIDMRYNPAFSVGLNCIYSVDKKNGIVLNTNLVKLALNGSFTIVTPLQSNATQINNRIKTFAIRGAEQRMMLQFGYQRIFGDNEEFNFFVEGGLHMTLTKFDKNEILINHLQIDLVSYYNQVAYPSAIPVKKPIGVGFGVFSGLGINMNLNPKFTIQLLYSPTYEQINIGTNPRLKLQNALGMRTYYNL